MHLQVTWAIAGAPAPTGNRSDLASMGRGSTTATADEAYVVVIFASEDEQGSPLSQKDRDELERAIVALGVAKKDIQIVTANEYGPVTIVQVETDVDEVEKRGDQVQRAAEKVLGRSDTSGVRFGLSSCDEALAKARKQAVGDAKTRATALAEAAGVRLGEIQAVSDFGSSVGADPCDDDAKTLLSFDEYGLGIEPFDANPEFHLETAVLLSWAIAV